MLILEIVSPDEENKLFRRGEQDGIRGRVPNFSDWSNREQEVIYFRGYDYGKSQMPIKKQVRVKIPTKFLKFIKRDVFNDVIDVARDGPANGVEGIKSSDITKKDIEDALEILAAESDNNGFMIYRSMDFSKKDSDRLNIAGANLGIYWSADSSYTMGHYGNQDYQIRMEATAPFGSVNWPETIATRLPNIESEIRLLSGSPVILHRAAIYRNGEGRGEVVVDTDTKHTA